MTLEERLKRIDTRVEEIRLDKFKMLVQAREEYEDASKEIDALKERVCDIIQVAQHCLDEKVFISDYCDVWRGNTFGFHVVDEYECIAPYIDWIGIYKESRDGKKSPYGFRTSGHFMPTGNLPDDDIKKYEELTEQINRLIGAFNKFEESFYHYIDNY